MTRYSGYEGGEGEEEIVAALTKLFAAADDDVATAIKTKYWPIGSAIEIAEARGYIKQLGLKGWMFTRFRKSETHARDCLKCWQETRRDFDEAWEWYKTGNSGFVPEKATGPRFAIELVKAWKERGRSDAEKKKKGKGKGKVLGVKELRQLCGALNNYLYRLSAEHSRWAQENNRDPRALIQITAERAKLEEELGIPQGDEGFEKFPLHTEKPPESPSATNSAGDPVSPKEPHPGADDPEKAVQADDDVVPSSGRHPGAEVLDDFMRRREAERRDMNRLIDQSGNALVTVETPAPITAETQKPVLLDAVAQSMTDEQYEAIVAARGLKGFGGAAGQNDRALLRKRAAIFHLKGDWSDEDAETICAFRQPFLRSVNKVEDVIERLPDERQQQLATRLNRKNRKRTEETKQD